MNTREEQDALGTVPVPADRYWGAQTQRALGNFAIGDQRMPLPLIRALGLVKYCAARCNGELDELPADIADAIARAAREVMDGRWDDHFPLPVWQTGSGTQSNMNANEVIANRACELLGGTLEEPVETTAAATGCTGPTMSVCVATVAVPVSASSPLSFRHARRKRLRASGGHVEIWRQSSRSSASQVA